MVEVECVMVVMVWASPRGEGVMRIRVITVPGRHVWQGEAWWKVRQGVLIMILAVGFAPIFGLGPEREFHHGDGENKSPVTALARSQATPRFAQYGDIYLYAPVSYHRHDPGHCHKLMACSRSQSR